jgi:hypothetical protein
MKFGFVVNRVNPTSSCQLVIRPNDELRAMGIDSRIIQDSDPVAALRECDVLLFHRTLSRLRELKGTKTVTGLDLADDLLANNYMRPKFDFLVTDSHPNTRFYLSPATHYWLHGFPDKTAVSSQPSAVTRFVWCGSAENLHTLVGAPLDALAEIARERPVTLRIITDLEKHREKWLGSIPKIEPANVTVEWLPFSQDTHEDLMKECDVGLFPQAIHLDRWRKKSMFKPSHAASLGLPSISSPTEEVCMNFTHGVNAYIADSPEQWVTAVRSMMDSAERTRVRENMLELFRTRFTLRLAAQQIATIARCELRRNQQRRFKGLRRLSLRVYVTAERLMDAVQRRLSRRAPSPQGKP